MEPGWYIESAAASEGASSAAGTAAAAIATSFVRVRLMVMDFPPCVRRSTRRRTTYGARYARRMRIQSSLTPTTSPRERATFGVFRDEYTCERAQRRASRLRSAAVV